MEKFNNSKIEILREKIKKMVDEKPEYSGSQLSEAEAMKLVHEIAVQQLELEMQNEELTQASEQAIIAAREYTDLYDFAPSGYFTLTTKGVIRKINISGATMLGKERISLINSQFGFFVSNNTRPDFNHFLSEIFIGQEMKNCEVILSDYGNMPMYVNLSGIVDPNGEQCFVTAVDISERKRMEEELRISEERYRAIFEQSVVGKTMTSVSDGKMIMNKSFCEMLGYSEAELSALNWQTITHPGDVEQDQQIGNSLISGEKEAARTEKRFVHKNGNIVWADASTSLIYNKENIPLFFNTSIINITRRKQAEDSLRRNESKYIKMLANIGDVIVVIDKKGINRYKSSNIEKLFGWIPKEVIGKSTWELVHPDDLDSAQQFVGNLMNEPNAVGTTECRYRCKDGSYKWIEITMMNLMNDPDIHGILGNYHDITERKAAEQQLITAKAHAEESDRLKSAFLANMSHEIRTPMNGILGFAGLLKESELTGEHQLQYINIIEKSGVRMLNIINDIIDISKIESQQMKLSVLVTNINEKIEYIYTFLKPETDKKGIDLRFNNGLPAKEANILTDSEKIYAILTNLVKNAIKFCDKGAIELGYNLVETHCRASLQHATFLEFYVKDTGIGIPKDRQEAIFDRFVQADISDKRAFQGAGLGLSISKAYVEMLGGKIWVESEEGKGSTFYFTLPYRTEAEDETVNKNIISVKDAITLIKKLNVLIAEDDEVSEKLIEVEVKEFSKKVLKAKTGIEAIEVCHKNPDIDLVLMDIKMPVMDGYEATRQIRQFNKKVVIIAQTASALKGDSEKAINVGCNDYISKPINKGQFHKLIQKHFQEQD